MEEACEDVQKCVRHVLKQIYPDGLGLKYLKSNLRQGVGYGSKIASKCPAKLSKGLCNMQPCILDMLVV